VWLRLQALALTGRPSLELDQRHLLCFMQTKMQARVGPNERNWLRWDERIRAGGRRAVSGRRAEHIPVVRYLYGVYESPDTTNGVRIRPARNGPCGRRCSTGDSLVSVSSEV